MTKARITARRFLSMAGLKFASAVLAVKISALIKEELQKKEFIKCFCTENNFVSG